MCEKKANNLNCWPSLLELAEGNHNEADVLTGEKSLSD